MPRRLLTVIVLALVGCFISLSLASLNRSLVIAAMPSAKIIVQSTAAVQQEEQGRQQYETRQFALALKHWQTAALAYQNQGDVISQARVLSNLALAYQQLGQWSEAEQAIEASLTLLQTESALRNPTARLTVLAQVLNNQGTLQFAQGKMEQAILTWERAAGFYAQEDNQIGIHRSKINQAQALQTLGLYQRALKILTQVSQELETESDSSLKVVSLRLLGNTLRLTGDLNRAQQILEESIAIAQRLSDPEDKGIIRLSLGKLALARGDRASALAYYQQAATLPTSTATRLQIHLAQLSLQLDTQQWVAATALLAPINADLAQLPPSHSKIYAQINLADSLIRLQQAQTTEVALPATVPSWREIAELLKEAAEQAGQLGDQRAEAYALGNLGEIYENTQQTAIAQSLTERALIIAQAINAPEITYRWQWQLGRLLSTQGQRESAIGAYSEAVNTLQSIRADLASNPEIQFSFQEKVEPVYRELVSLLLEPDAQGNVPQNNLAQARDVIELLQLAELDNFFREACLEVKPVQIDQVDPQAAVLYSIILRDRLAVILSLPQQPLRLYTISLAQEKLETLIAQLSYQLVVRSRREFFKPAQQLYDWLIRPAETALAQSGVKTLVFVLDGSLRNIPMASLYDGKHYLIEQYRITITPGLQLLAPQALQAGQLNILAAGLTQQREGFAPLNYVSEELQAIQANVPSVILLNQEFTTQALQEKIEYSPFPIVHLATHGKFSSSIDETFILAWDDRIDINQLHTLLQSRNYSPETALELLVLSACETATGDKRAALGLAGMAVRAGARSTVASLWSVNDQATTEFMSQFYRALASDSMTKSEALRQAQLALLKNRWYKHPFYWAPYILVGNWL